MKGKVHHVVVDGEDALIAALKAKCEQPDALIMYVRPQNRREMRGIRLSLGSRQRVSG